MPKTVAIIQARLGSKRLPNKVLMEIVPGISMLEMVVRKASLAALVDDIVICTRDKQLVRIADMVNIYCQVYGKEKRDVIDEYELIVCSMIANIEIIVRLTADCPLLRPEEIDKCIQAFLDNEVDLVYNTECEKDMIGDGLDVEVFSRGALEMAHKHAKDREHVTSWMRGNLKTLFVPAPDFDGCSVDTQEDLDKVREILRRN